MKYDIFISYSHHDIEKVKEIKDYLERSANLTCWMDMKGIESGSQFEDVIISAIDNSEIVLFILSDSSMQSKWAKDEVRYSYQTGKKVVPLNIDGCKPSGWFLFKFSGRDVIDYSDKDQWKKLIENLNNWTGEESKKDDATYEEKPKKKPATKENDVELLMRKYQHFTPRKRWRLPIIQCTLALLLLLPTFTSGIFWMGAIIDGCTCSVSDEDKELKTIYNEETGEDENTGEYWFSTTYSGVTNTITGYAYNCSSREEALNEAQKDFWGTWWAMFFVLGAFLFPCLAILYLIYKKHIPHKKHGYISDFADTIESYHNYGIGNSFKFYIKDGKFGVADVSHFRKVTEPVFDNIEWKTKYSIYSGTINGITKLYDVNIGELT